MRKISKLNILNLILLMVVVLLSVFQFVFKFIPINPKEFCILIILFAMGVSLFTKGVLFKSSNSVWFSLIIFSYCIFLFLSVLFGNLRAFYASAFLILPAILGVIVYIIYKEIIYLKLSILLLFVSTPVLLFNFKVISLLLFIILLLVFSISGFLLQMIINNKNDKG